MGAKGDLHLFALKPSAMLHEFRIDSVLGYRGFGITYAATDTNLQQRVAIKEYLPNDIGVRVSDETVRAKAADEQKLLEDGVAEFLNEARMVAGVRDDNIMEVKRFFNLHGIGYIVLGYEEGETLKERLDRED
jgi:serine/threonine protein kinase